MNNLIQSNTIVSDTFILDGVDSTGNQLGLVLEDEGDMILEEEINSTSRVKDGSFINDSQGEELPGSSSPPLPGSSHSQEIDSAQIEADYTAKQEEESRLAELERLESTNNDSYREQDDSLLTHASSLPSISTDSSFASITFPFPSAAQPTHSNTSPSINRTTSSSPTPTANERYSTNSTTVFPPTPTDSRFLNLNLNTEKQSPDFLDMLPNNSSFSRGSSTTSNLNSKVSKGKGKAVVEIIKKVKGGSNKIGKKVGSTSTGGGGKMERSQRSRSIEPDPPSPSTRTVRQFSAPPSLSTIKQISSSSTSKIHTPIPASPNFFVEVPISSRRGSKNNFEVFSSGGKTEKPVGGSAIRERLEVSGKELAKEVNDGNNSSDISRVEETELEDTTMEELSIPTIPISQASSIVDPLTVEMSSPLSPLSPSQSQQERGSLSPFPFPSRILTDGTANLRKPRAAQRAAVINSSQNSEAMDSTQDFVVPKSKEKGKGRASDVDEKREYGFSLVIETSSTEESSLEQFKRSKPFPNPSSSDSKVPDFYIAVPDASSSNINSKRSAAKPLPLSSGQSPEKKRKGPSVLSNEADMDEDEDENARGSSPLSSVPSLNDPSSELSETLEEGDDSSDDVDAEGEDDSELESDDKFKKEVVVKKKISVDKGRGKVLKKAAPKSKKKPAPKSNGKKVALAKEDDNDEDVSDTEEDEVVEEEIESSSDAGDSYSEEEIPIPKKKLPTNKKSAPVKKIVEKKVKADKKVAVKRVVKEKVIKSKKLVLAKKVGSSLAPSTSQTNFHSSGMMTSANSQVAPIETPEEQALLWSLKSMEDLCWANVEGQNSSRFWWPADIQGLRSARPLQVKLLLDTSEEILNFSSLNIAIDEPLPTNILSFRSIAKQGRIRFDFNNFSNSASSTSDPLKVPNEECFSAVLMKAVNLETIRDDGSASEGEDIEIESDEEEEELEGEAEVESDDELTRKDDEGSGFIYPFKVLGLDKSKWWPGVITGFIPSDNPKKPGKFAVSWSDGLKGFLTKTQFLTPSSPQGRFYTVPLGATKFEVPKNYNQQLTDFVHSIHSTLQLIIDDEFSPATSWNKAFYGGPASRATLAKSARYGELYEEHLDTLRAALAEWMEGNEGSLQPMGCSQYELLSPQDRVTYISDLLLPITSYLYHISENQFRAVAIEELEEELGEVEPTEDQILEKAFSLASEHFELGSVTKWVHSCREAKSIVDADSKGPDPRRR